MCTGVCSQSDCNEVFTWRSQASTHRGETGHLIGGTIADAEDPSVSEAPSPVRDGPVQKRQRVGDSGSLSPIIDAHQGDDSERGGGSEDIDNDFDFQQEHGSNEQFEDFDFRQQRFDEHFEDFDHDFDFRQQLIAAMTRVSEAK